MNTITIPNVPAPSWATEVRDWEPDGVDASAARISRRDLGGGAIGLEVVQFVNGSSVTEESPALWFSEGDYMLGDETTTPSDELRAIAAAMLEAADLLEQEAGK